jgi:hypothetical protein
VLVDTFKRDKERKEEVKFLPFPFAFFANSPFSRGKQAKPR